jgi:hypothetical protein
MHGPQAGDCGEQAECAPACRDEQGGIGRRDLSDVVAGDVGDHEDARLRCIVER